MCVCVYDNVTLIKVCSYEMILMFVFLSFFHTDYWTYKGRTQHIRVIYKIISVASWISSLNRKNNLIYSKRFKFLWITKSSVLHTALQRWLQPRNWMIFCVRRPLDLSACHIRNFNSASSLTLSERIQLS